jgi:hypothetical protein
MVLLSCSGTGGDIYAKLAKRSGSTQLHSGFPYPQFSGPPLLGAIQKKIFAWHTGFWGKSGTNGWSYDTMLVVVNLVIVTTGGGNLALTRLFG